MRLIAFIVALLPSLFIGTSEDVHPDGDILSLLPKSGEIPSWQSLNQPSVYYEDTLFDYIDGGADIFLEYGFDALAVQEYANNDRSILVEIYKMKDSCAAFGIYSLRRDHRLPKLKVGNDGVVGDYQVSFWQGNYYVVVRTYRSDKEANVAMATFAKNIAKKIGPEGAAPSILKVLPQKHLIPRSQKYVKGLLAINSQYYFSRENIFQLGNGNDGVFADYIVDGERIRLFLARYAYEREARSIYKNAAKYFETTFGAKGGIKKKSAITVVVQDEKGKYLVMTIKGKLIALVLDSPTEKAALTPLHEIGHMGTN